MREGRRIPEGLDAALVRGAVASTEVMCSNVPIEFLVGALAIFPARFYWSEF